MVLETDHIHKVCVCMCVCVCVHACVCVCLPMRLVIITSGVMLTPYATVSVKTLHVSVFYIVSCK